VRDDEDRLTGRIVELVSVYGRYGTLRIHAMLRHEGWRVNHKRVERIWRQAGLKVPKKQPKRGRLWLNDGSCIRLRPEHKDHVWAYDFVSARTHDGVPLRLLVIMDAFTRECLSIDAARSLSSDDVLGTPAGHTPALYAPAVPACIVFRCRCGCARARPGRRTTHAARPPPPRP
jgi:transposase InsO family protein